MMWNCAMGGKVGKSWLRSAFALLLPVLLVFGALAGLSRSAQASTYTQGGKTFLFIKVDFPDKQGDPIPDANAQALVQTVFDFYKDCSYGSTTLSSVTVTPTLRMSNNTSVYVNNAGLLLTEAQDAAAKAGYDFRKYNFHLLGFSTIGYGWAGLGYVGAPGAWINGYFDLRVVSHEVGHNLGLLHANYWDSIDGTATGAGTPEEYGDAFDAMGGVGGTKAYHFNTNYKNQLDWLPGTSVQNVTVSGTYRIEEHDNPAAAGLRALKIPGSGRTYWVEYRKQFNNVYLQNGASIRWRHPGDNGSELLDMTPDSSPNGYSDKLDSALVIGRTFSDPGSKVYITPIKRIAGNVEQLEINANIGDFPGNSGPQVTITASTTKTLPGNVVDFTASANDPDGDTLAYYWDFGDGGYSSLNSPTISHSWAANGDYVVRVTVSDMKGGTGSASVAVKVGDPNSLRVSGTVLSTCGSPVADADVAIAALNKTTKSNSDGTYTLTGIKVGTYDVTATDPSGAAIAPANFTNPLKVDDDKTDINFGAKAPDSIAPSLTIDTPKEGDIVSTLAASGTTSDNTGGCGIERVEIGFHRHADGKHWNGFGWVDGHAHLSVTLSGTTWSKRTGLPLDKDLEAGKYHIEVQSFDKNYNRAFQEIEVNVPEAPTISISKPLNGATVNALTTVAGAAKSPDGEALTITYKLQRLSDGRYFNGSTWAISHPDVAPTFTATFDATTGIWSSSTNLPTASQMTSGAYRLIALATTPIGRRDSAVSSFLVDRGAPFVAFTKPAASGSVNSLTNLIGYAIDNPGEPGATGIAKVVVRIKRNSDGKWWTGTEWGTQSLNVPTSLQNKQFTNGGGVEWTADSSKLPTKSNTVGGSYTLQATATDLAGNSSTTTIQATIDTTSPLVEIFLPKNNAVVTDLVTRGTARDDVSGIDKVNLTIQRDSDKKYWDGTMWTSPKPAPTETFPGASLLVGSYNGGLVKQFDAASGASQTIFAKGINHPESIIFGPDTNGDGYPELFVAERLASRVVFYDGKSKESLGVFAQGGGLVYPTGIAFMPNGDLLVANGHGEGKKPDGSSYVYASFPTSIKRFDSHTRAYLGDFVLPNSGGVTNGFEGICWGNDLDGDGVRDLYVAALFDNKVPVYSGVDGAYIRDFVITGDGSLKYPTDVQFGPDNTDDGVSDCYVASSGTDDIKLYDGVTGIFVKDFVADNDGASYGLNGPERILFGPDGQLYVSSFGTAGANAGSGSSVLRFDSKTGAPKPGAGQSNAVFATGDLNGPAGLTFNPVATGAVTPPTPGPAVMVVPTLNTNYAAINYVFARGAGLPAGSNLPAGRYIISATGYDRAGNSATHTISVIVGAAPAVTITTPANGSTVSTTLSISGEAKGVSGIAKVLLYLQRSSDSAYWTGSSWGAKTGLTTSLTAVTGGVKWSRPTGLPSGSLLTAGTYRVEAVAYDNNGLTATASNQFSVTTSGGGGTGGTAVTVSQATATASTRTVKLVFTGLLNGQSAMTPSNYTLTINGQVVNVESASYSATNYTVLLKPPANTLFGGSTVQVSWNLIDSFGKVTTGKTEAFTAAP